MDHNIIYGYFERVRHYEYEPVVILREPADGSGALERWDTATSAWVDASDQRRLLDGGTTYAPISAADAAVAIAVRRPATTRRESPQMCEAESISISLEGGVSSLTTAAIAMHELFTTLVAAGFTENHALTIVVGILRGQSPSHDGSD